MLGEAAHVQFIDDRLNGTDAGGLVVAPVECVMGDQAASGAAPAVRGNAPACATRQHLGVGIQELLPGIEALQVRCWIGEPCGAHGFGYRMVPLTAKSQSFSLIK